MYNVLLAIESDSIFCIENYFVNVIVSCLCKTYIHILGEMPLYTIYTTGD